MQLELWPADRRTAAAALGPDPAPAGAVAVQGWPSAETYELLRWALLDPAPTDGRLWLAVVRDPSGALVVGEALLRSGPPEVEVAYALAPPWRGRGVGSALVRQVVDEAFRLPGTVRVVAEVHVANVASRRAAERAGLRLVGRRGALAAYALDRVDRRAEITG